MTNIVVRTLAVLGIACFIVDVAWINHEVQSLLIQNKNLLELGLNEEAAHYKIQADTLSTWKMPIAILGFAFVLPFVVSLLLHRVKKNAI